MEHATRLTNATGFTFAWGGVSGAMVGGWGVGWFLFGRLRCVERPFPFRDDDAGDRVADNIGGGAAHIEEMVNTQDEQQACLWNAEHGERCGKDN